MTDVSPNRRLSAPWQYEGGRENVEKATALSAQRLTRLRGLDIMRDPNLNKGTAFTERERDLLGLRGLLPPTIFSIQDQLARQYASFKKLKDNLGKYLFLERLHNRNETLYYRFLLEYIKESMPIVYTPTVGQACIEFSDMYRSRPRGLFMSKLDQDNFREVVKNWPQHDIDIVVITDGSRILGLGDLGINGMGIPIGKLALYVAAAGFLPWKTLPITVDVGTDNQTFRNADNYIGLKSDRPGDEEFYSIMRKAIDAIMWRWPKTLIQFEDFSNEHAFGLLDKYKEKILCFNDDIQGTASTALAGLIAALRIQKVGATGADPTQNTKLSDQRIVFLGAGSAGVGVASLIAEGMAIENGEKDAAKYRKKNFWLIDSKGVVTKNRGDTLQDHKIPFARDDDSIKELSEVIKRVKPTMLIGLAGLTGGSFTETMVKQMDKDCVAQGLRPIIMALSNPTSKAECTAEQAYTWTEGRVIFASGSPFDPVTLKNGKTYHTGQGNNMYIFPGVGYGAVMCRTRTINDAMFYEAAKRLSKEVTVEDLAKGSVYPDLNNIRNITANVAAGICSVAQKDGLAEVKTPPGYDWFNRLAKTMWWPEYEEYV